MSPKASGQPSGANFASPASALAYCTFPSGLRRELPALPAPAWLAALERSHAGAH
ncbi:hypothetical protein [Massilia sp. TWR1-2-2]|uniref:hypothetical protein n=1 Tax=Massilia sp. TWR1-2-2 TaxID=2804584 RepID=UPI003CF1588D